MVTPRSDSDFMQLALDVCRQGIEAGQSPFGACIVRAGEILAVAHNHVWHHCDPTAHAEVVAIRHACARTRELHLVGATIYSTTEPCPMCFTAIHWARIERIVFAARVEDAAAFGFNELAVSNRTLNELAHSELQLVPDFRREDALALFQSFKDRSGRTY